MATYKILRRFRARSYTQPPSVVKTRTFNLWERFEKMKVFAKRPSLNRRIDNILPSGARLGERK